VTIVKSKEEVRLTGVVYTIKEENKENILKELDFREKNGYTRISITSYNSENDEIIDENTIIYIGLEEYNLHLIYKSNPQFEMNEDIKKTANVISNNVGPSGENYEYFIQLSNFLNENKIKDTYIEDLKKEIMEIRKKEYYIEKGLELLTLNQNYPGLDNTLGIKYTHVSRGLMKGKLFVSKKLQQPSRYMHGGVSLSFMESLASYGSFLYNNGLKFVLMKETKYLD
jgi:cation transport regulator ChaC